MALQPDVDILIIGGGVNGAGIARDAAGRGLSVALCEQVDLAGATSSASSKLIHGGLRYLEYFDFRLVREALIERERMLAIAPHIVRPTRFILPTQKSMRPPWMIAIGLFLYDRLGPRKRLGASERIDLSAGPEGEPLKPGFKTGFAYWDCSVDDARLVVLNALDARERGARIHTRTQCVGARRRSGGWIATLRDIEDGAKTHLTARTLVNAAGPWAHEVLDVVAGPETMSHLRLIKGSHIIIPQLFAGDHAYILLNEDQRVIFVMPYEGSFTLIGTTEAAFAGDPAKVAISDEEIAYLCRAASRCFRAPVTPQQIVHTFSGVRPLYDDGAQSASAISRDYVLDLDAPKGGAPILSVFGGKITTYRPLAERAVEALAPYLLPPRPGRWTQSVPLPGGDMDGADFDLFLRRFQADHPWLPRAEAMRLARAYGTRAPIILGKAQSVDDLGASFGASLSQAEIDYLVDQEWAMTAEDILWRRSKLGLHMTREECDRVAAYLSHRANEGALPIPPSERRNKPGGPPAPSPER